MMEGMTHTRDEVVELLKRSARRLARRVRKDSLPDLKLFLEMIKEELDGKK